MILQHIILVCYKLHTTMPRSGYQGPAAVVIKLPGLKFYIVVDRWQYVDCIYHINESHLSQCIWNGGITRNATTIYDESLENQ